MNKHAAVPEGFKLVPIDPTEEMVKAGGHANSEWLNDNAPIGEARYARPMLSVYAAMLAAADALQSAVPPPSYSCSKRANGGPTCNGWCKDAEKCIASPMLENARALIEERYTGQGAAAPLGSSNPYRSGSDAFKFWQTGHEPQPVPKVPNETQGIDYELAWRGACSQIEAIAKERDDAENELDACAAALPGPYYMDPPDGGSVSVSEQVARMVKDAARYRWARSFEHCNAAWCFIGGGCAAKSLDDEIDEAMKAEIEADIAEN